MSEVVKHETKDEVVYSFIPDKKYSIVEIFSSIQGEGCLMGTPATFIRLSGCNLSCPWCDTKVSWKDNGNEMSVAEIVAKVDKTFVVITGGEPLIHDLEPLLKGLQEKGSYVAIETNGTIEIPEEINKMLFWVACAPKPQSEYVLKTFPNELKFVMYPEVEEEVINAIKKLNLGERIAARVAIWLQPEGSNWEKNIKFCYEVAMKYPELNLRVGLQLHKVVDVR